MKQMSEKGSVIHADAYEKYYSTHLKKYQDLDPSIEVDYYRSKFRSVMPQDRKARILEIGSGLGKFGYFLKTEGYTNFTCVDVSPEMAHLAKKHAGIDVVLVSEPMEFLALHRNEYDVVFMLDVIEHIRKEQVVEYLRLVQAALKPGGWLHLTTENMASPIGGRIQHYLDFTHEYNYSEVSLRQVLELAGFSEINLWSMRDSIGRTPKQVGYWVLRRVWFTVLRIIYAIERPGMVNPKIFGKELIASARV